MRVSLTLLGNFLQRNYYTFCSQIDKVYLYVFQRRFKILLAREKLKLVALHTLKHSQIKKRECSLISMSLVTARTETKEKSR